MKQCDNEKFRLLFSHKELHSQNLIYASQQCAEMTASRAFDATGLFLNPLKISENQRFSDVFGRYKKRPVA